MLAYLRYIDDNVYIIEILNANPIYFYIKITPKFSKETSIGLRTIINIKETQLFIVCVYVYVYGYVKKVYTE